MQRRQLIAASAATLAAPGAFVRRALAQSPVSPLRAAARAAFIYASPIVEVASTRERFLSRNGAGRLVGRMQLSTPASRGVTTPNNDTLAASTFIDLSGGAARLTVPPFGGRYASLALMDMFTNNFSVLSPRTLSGGGHSFQLVGPRGPQHHGLIDAPTTWVWVLVRVLVDGPADLGAAAALLDAFKVEAQPAGPYAPGAAWDAPWADYLAAANRLIQENGTLPIDAAMLARMAPLGFPSPRFDPAHFSAADAAEIAAGVEDARTEIRRPMTRANIRGGWAFEAPGVGDFGQDYESRARVALGGLAALPRAEATYMNALAPDGRRLFTGAGPWRITFPPGGAPPARAFWSLTLYEAEPDGRNYLAANPIDRYSIGDRTHGLVRDPDGGLTLWIARTDPGPARRANWLPAPAAGPFILTLRAYLPGPQILAGAYTPPPVTAA